MSSGHVLIVQCVHDFDGGHGAEIAIEVAAAGHGVNVRAEEDGFKRAVTAGANGGYIAGGINAGVEAGGAHQAHGVFTTGDVGVRIRNATDTVGKGAAGRAAVYAKTFEALLQASSIDARSCNVYCKRHVRQGSGGQAKEQFTAGKHARDYIRGKSPHLAAAAW